MEESFSLPQVGEKLFREGRWTGHCRRMEIICVSCMERGPAGARELEPREGDDDAHDDLGVASV